MKAIVAKQIYEAHAKICQVLSNPKRLEVIDLLRTGEKAVGELMKQMGVTKANLSQQLAVMRDKGVLETRREGQKIYYRLAFPKMLRAYDLLREILIEKMKTTDSMGQHLKKLGPKKGLCA